MSRSRDACRCEHETGCFFCEMPLTTLHEHDHYPVAKALGGTETVPACMTCHDAKDRIPLGEWPVNTALRAIEEISAVYPEWNPWPRSELPPSDLQRLSPGPARVLLAKWVRLWHEMTVVARGMCDLKDSAGRPVHTVSEIAQVLGVSRATIYDHLAPADAVAKAEPA